MAAGQDAETRFRELYQSSYRKLLAYARRRTATPEDAEDVVSETFRIAWARLDELEKADSPIAWLYGVARRVLSNQRRSQGRSAALVVRLGGIATETEEDTAAETAAARHELDAVAEAMRSLSEQDQEILALAAFEGATPAEIAAVLGISGARARTNLFRARPRLRRSYRSPFDEEGS